ncbi:hypothetical protein L9F63_014150, partial [Diploptera punctata]
NILYYYLGNCSYTLLIHERSMDRCSETAALSLSLPCTALVTRINLRRITNPAVKAYKFPYISLT